MTKILDQVNHPHDLKELSLEQLEQLAAEIRQRIVEVVNRNGGHLASNLGSVELTLALHRVFDFPRDRLVWDTSHQTYPHKLITGRRDRFHMLRKYQGICGFSNKKESVFDLFDAGHAGTACSLALGVSCADHILKRANKSVAVAGDAAIAAGMAFEALNHAGTLQRNLLVVLNDNRMSIDKSVGALSRHLNRVRAKPLYQDLKRDIHTLLSHVPFLGRKVEDIFEQLRETFKHTVIPGLIFQELGFNYYGPVDGHDLEGLIQILEDLKQIKAPVLLHALTEKGHGYDAAVADPTKYHALKNFLEQDQGSNGEAVRPEDDEDGGRREPARRKRPAFTDVFKQVIHETARKDRRIVAITAAMAGGTGLKDFAREFPDRYFDVGIAEQHGCALASGLAGGGSRPVFAVYSTFCQRAYDQFVHDTCMQENSVIFCLDRAGLVGEDGWTHHGVLDIAIMRCVPNCILMAPRDAEEFIQMFQLAVDQSSRTAAIRYPKTAVPELPPSREPAVRIGKGELLVEGERVALFAYGSMVAEAYRAAGALRGAGLTPTVVNARFAKPIDAALLEQLASSHDLLVTLEEHALPGGFGSAVLETITDRDIRFQRVLRLGVPDRFISFGKRELLLRECGLDATGIAEAVAAAASTLPRGRKGKRPAVSSELSAARK
jgi:1-deoxy-D-xylulose-5-phosphate synthase